MSPCSGILLKIEGMSRVLWREGVEESAKTFKSKVLQSPWYVGSLIYVSKYQPKCFLGQYAASQSQDPTSRWNDLSCTFPQELYVEAYATVFSASSGGGGGGGGGGGRRRGVLPEGVHTFAFRFVLPENVPSSFEGKFGRVK